MSESTLERSGDRFRPGIDVELQLHAGAGVHPAIKPLWTALRITDNR
jgi:hypothetical protein